MYSGIEIDFIVHILKVEDNKINPTDLDDLSMLVNESQLKGSSFIILLNQFITNLFSEDRNAIQNEDGDDEDLKEIAMNMITKEDFSLHPDLKKELKRKKFQSIVQSLSERNFKICIMNLFERSTVGLGLC